MTDDLRDQLENAPEMPPIEGDAVPGGDASAPDKSEDKAENRHAPPPRRDGRPRGEIWEGCPVKPLGVYGDITYYLDVKGQLRDVAKHEQQKILHIFGDRNGLLASRFPQYDQSGNPKSGPKFDALNASSTMINAAFEKGVWSPTSRMRGPGAWLDEDGKLIIHAGDEILIDGKWQPPGVYGDMVYAASDPAPRPTAKITRRDAARELLEDLTTWQWRRPDVDAQLVLGAICAQIMGGALEWRPVTWITGDAATGKSTLQQLMLAVHGGSSGLMQAADATEAGIRSVLGFSSLPVAIDELEPDKDQPRKVKAVIELARRAASGAQIFRGSSDQKGHQSTAYSCFLFSSILVPPMPAQDRSRLILLDLDRLPDGAPKLTIDRRRLRGLGAHLRRALLDGWDTWEARVEMFRIALADHGQSGRGADNYATTLALADMALSPAALPSVDTVDGWAKKLSHAVTEDAMEVGSNADDMLVHLLSQFLDIWRRGSKHTVAEWLQFSGQVDGAPSSLGEATDPGQATRLLGPFGLRVYGRGDKAELCIASKQLQGLNDLFRDSQWQDGGWSQAARRLQGATAQPPTSFSGSSSRGWRIPFTSIPGLLALPAQAKSAPAAQSLPLSVTEDFV